MLVLVVVGFMLGQGHGEYFHPFFSGSASGSLKAIGAALVPMAFAYSGWNSTVVVGEEVKNPGRIIPLSMIIGTLATAGIYVLMNAIYLYSVPLASIVGSETVANLAAQNLFGPMGGIFIKILVATSVLGCLSATMLTNPRTTFALGRDGYFFQFAGKIHDKYSTPYGAIFIQGGWACVLILQGNFGQILRFLSVPLVIIGAMTVFSIFVFRWKRPDVERPYRCWGYPIVPLLYCGISIWMLYETFMARLDRVSLGWGALSVSVPTWLAGVAIFIIGIPVYYLWKRYYPSAHDH